MRGGDERVARCVCAPCAGVRGGDVWVASSRVPRVQAVLSGSALGHAPQSSVLAPTSRQLGELFRPLGLSLCLVRPRVPSVPSGTSQLLGTVRNAVKPGHQGLCPHTTVLSPGHVAGPCRAGAGVAWHTTDLCERLVNVSVCQTSHG